MTSSAAQLVMSLTQLLADNTEDTISISRAELEGLMLKTEEQGSQVTPAEEKSAEKFAAQGSLVTPLESQVTPPVCWDRQIAKRNLRVVPNLKREDGELNLRQFRDRFVLYVSSVDSRLGDCLKKLPSLSPDNVAFAQSQLQGLNTPMLSLQELTSAFLSKLDEEFWLIVPNVDDHEGFVDHYLHLMSVLAPAEEESASTDLSALLLAEMKSGEGLLTFAGRLQHARDRVNRKYGQSAVSEAVLLNTFRTAVLKADPTRYGQAVITLQCRPVGTRLNTVMQFATMLLQATWHSMPTKKVNKIEVEPSPAQSGKRRGNRRGGPSRGTGNGGRPRYCFDFAREGSCSRGDDCRFTHDHRVVAIEELESTATQSESLQVPVTSPVPVSAVTRVVRVQHALAQVVRSGAILDSGAAQSCSAAVENPRDLEEDVEVEVADGSRTPVTRVGEVTIGGTVFENVLEVPGLRTLIAVSPYDRLGCTFTIGGGMKVGRTGAGRVFVVASLNTDGLYHIVDRQSGTRQESLALATSASARPSGVLSPLLISSSLSPRRDLSCELPFIPLELSRPEYSPSPASEEKKTTAASQSCSESSVPLRPPEREYEVEAILGTLSGGADYYGPLVTEDEVDFLLNHDADTYTNYNWTTKLAEEVICRHTGVRIDLATQGPVEKVVSQAGASMYQEHNTYTVMNSQTYVKGIDAKTEYAHLWPTVTPQDTNTAVTSLDFPHKRIRGVPLDALRITVNDNPIEAAMVNQLVVTQALSTWGADVADLCKYIDCSWNINYSAKLVSNVAFARVGNIAKFVAFGGRPTPSINLSSNLTSRYHIVGRPTVDPTDEEYGYTSCFTARSEEVSRFNLISDNILTGRSRVIKKGPDRSSWSYRVQFDKDMLTEFKRQHTRAKGVKLQLPAISEEVDSSVGNDEKVEPSSSVGNVEKVEFSSSVVPGECSVPYTDVDFGESSVSSPDVEFGSVGNFEKVEFSSSVVPGECSVSCTDVDFGESSVSSPDVEFGAYAVSSSPPTETHSSESLLQSVAKFINVFIFCQLASVAQSTGLLGAQIVAAFSIGVSGCYDEGYRAPGWRSIKVPKSHDVVLKSINSNRLPLCNGTQFIKQDLLLMGISELHMLTMSKERFSVSCSVF